MDIQKREKMELLWSSVFCLLSSLFYIVLYINN